MTIVKAKGKVENSQKEGQIFHIRSKHYFINKLLCEINNGKQNFGLLPPFFLLFFPQTKSYCTDIFQ